MKPTIWVWESQSFWSRTLRIKWGSCCQISTLATPADFVSFREYPPVSPNVQNYLAVEYSRKILEELFSLFDKIPSKLENLSWILLDAPRSVHSQVMLREIGFSVFLNDLSSLNALQGPLQFENSGWDGQSSQSFRNEMFQRIPLPKAT